MGTIDNDDGANDDEDDISESPRSRTGPFFVPHRGGTRVEVSEPIHCGGEKPWLCAVKLVGRKGPDVDVDVEATQTLLVRTGRGATPEEAQRNALSQLTLVYGSPVEPAPSTTIRHKITDPPPELPKRPSLFARLFSKKKEGDE
jgi:hypothetical protein